ncbi:MAG: hypothetical protein JJU28_09840 [Cyclobacteriaceae bacterium]|nr:hypothetical protein [Cyclobacteriaceae bacterium]
MNHILKHTAFWLLLFNYINIPLLASMPQLITKDEDKKKDKSQKNAVYLIAGGQLDFHAVRDFGVSPLWYEGMSPGFSVGLLEHSEKTFHKLSFGYSYGLIEPSIDFGLLYRTRNHSVIFDHSYLKRVAYMDKLKVRMYLGPSIVGTYHGRINPELNNASFHYDFVAGIGPGIRFERDFSIQKKRKLWFITISKSERHFTGGFQLNLPVFYTFMRPEYAVIRDFTDGSSGFSGENDINFGSLNRLYKINTTFDFQYFLKNGNGLRLAYTWDVGELYNGFNDLQTAHHVIQMFFMYKFNSTEKR